MRYFGVMLSAADELGVSGERERELSAQDVTGSPDGVQYHSEGWSR
jgi:hypothetical protein